MTPLYNVYPLLSRYQLSFQSNGQVLLSSLPVLQYGINIYKGTWRVAGSKVLLTFPLFPFRGDTDHYAGTFEIDVIPPDSHDLCAARRHPDHGARTCRRGVYPRPYL